MATLSEAMEEAMASAPTDRIMIDTVEIIHPGFVAQDGVTRTSARLVKDNFPLRAKLEASADIDAGQVVRFEPLMFSMLLPKSTSNELPFIDVAIDNVDNVLTYWTDLAARDHRKTTLIYRPYLFYPDSDLIDGDVRVAGVSNALARTPEMDPPVRMTISDITLTRSRVTFKARPLDYINMKFPKELYTKARFPAL